MMKSTKPAKGTTQTASAKPKRFAPITLKMPAKDSSAVADLISLPTRELKELMRVRLIPIPKSKDDMVVRLIAWLDAHNTPVTVTIG